MSCGIYVNCSQRSRFTSFVLSVATEQAPHNQGLSLMSVAWYALITVPTAMFWSINKKPRNAALLA